MTKKPTVTAFLTASLEDIFGSLDDRRVPVIILDPIDWERVSLESPPGEVTIVWQHKKIEKGSLELRMTAR